MRLYGGTMSRVIAALVLTLVAASGCSGSSESGGSLPRGPRATDDTTTTTTVVGPEVEGVQLTPTSSIPAGTVTPPLPPPATPSGGFGGPYPRRGLGCRRAPYPKCSLTNKRPCCRPGDPANARFHQGANAGR